MAVNHADGTLFFSVMFYPIAAGKAAIGAQAGWFTILFVAVSIPFGIAINAGGRKLIYFGMNMILGMEPEKRSMWFQWLIGGPALLVYFVLPYAIVGAGVYATWLSTVWLVRHLS